MAELDKLKRRIIRLVAQKQIVEKKSNDVVWQELKTETGFDCEVLWKRMRALTLKKISRLLPACDLIDSIPPVAHMSITDWLLFDLVLVHEDIDLIGQDTKSQNDPKPLIELMFIVHTLNIEGKSGDELVDAWTKATVTYNAKRRRCSPMLLQKRWHQLKTATRNNFYNFWFSYRGSDKFLLRAKNQYMPSKLQMAIAQRYTHVITNPFMDWNECIKRKLVILPDDFEKKMQKPQEVLKESELQPDIMLVEPNIETIELNDGDSDTEIDQKGSSNSQNSIPKTSDNIGRQTKIKTEHVNEEETIKPTISSLSEQLLERDEQLLSNIDNDVQVTKNKELVDCISTNKDNGTNINIKSSLVTDNNSDDDIIEVTDDKDILSTETPELTSKKYRLDCNVGNIPDMNSEIIQIETDVIVSPGKELEVHTAMPQITSVFGNVNDDTDVLDQLSKFTTNKTFGGLSSVVRPVHTDSQDIDAYEQKDLEVAVNEKLGSYLEKMKKTPFNEGITNKINSVPIKEAEAKEATENIPQMNSEHPFLDLTADLTFVDGGIELIDDGIEFVDDEINPDIENDTAFQDNLSAIDLCGSADEENVDTEKFDMKLLMNPVVYTTKLDDMMVFKNKSIHYIMDKNVLYSAAVESKPKSGRTVDLLEIKRNNTADCPIIENKDEIYLHESNDNEESILKSKRVKLSSPLLQKPKRRSYNPIQLCKNPDFNTRLKRLTVGFLSSMRNRSLLRTIKPMTIDISNAFETKLVNGTMYLKSSDTACDIIIDDDLSENFSAVMPSAMPAQTLIDHTKVNLQDILHSECDEINNSKPNESIFPQRNKAINLPDIENIRRMNRNLFTAEITPMRIQTTSGYYKPPVQLVPSSNYNEVVIASPSSLKTTEAPNISKTLNLHDSSNSCLPQHSQISHLQSNESSSLKKLSSIPSGSSDKEAVKQSTQKNRKTPVPSWLSKPFFPKGLKFDRGLLTIDTLRKMLSVMKEGKLISENFKDAMLASVIREIELQVLKKEDNSPQQKPIEPEKKNGAEESNPVPLLVKVPTANKRKPNISTANSNCKKASSLVANKNSSKRKIPAPNKHCNEPKIPRATNKFNVKINARQLPIQPELKPNIPPGKIQEVVEEKEQYCCWARKKLNNPSFRGRHPCHNVCFCCCRIEFLAECTAQLEKMKLHPIHINRFQNSHTSPIFLGKNNILLTNVPLPKEISKLPVLPKELFTDLVVPQGVQIIMSSNGQLSYTLEQGVKLSKEEFASLPAILEAARQQLSPSITNAFAAKSDDVYHIEDADINYTSELYSNSVQAVTGKAFSISIPPDILKKVTPDLVVPKGVKIILLPNGEMSYTIETGVKLTKEELATLPAILDAARQQLSPHIKNASSIKSHDICNIQNSIDLTGDDIAGEIKISNVVTLLNRGDIKTTQTDSQDCDIEMQNIEPITFSDKKVENITSTKTSLEKHSSDRQFSNTGTELVLTSETKEESENIESANYDIPYKSNMISNENKSATDNSSKVQDDTKLKESNSGICLDSNTTSNESIQATDDANKINDDKKIKGDNTEGDSQGTPTQRITSCNKGVTTTDDEVKNLAVGNTPVHKNKSNLLSDLMEMSGISSEDITFVTKEFLCVKPLTVPPLIPLIKTPSAPDTPPRYLQIAANAPPVITTSPSSDIQELCSITSYAHLKYAFEKNAKFFKLNLQSGAVLPIKVSLKKDLTATAFNITAQKPLPQLIDLTDEQDTPDTPVSETENNDELTSPIIKEPVRPLILFRSANILQRKIANAAFKKVPKPNMSQVGRGQKRKQKLDETSTQIEANIGNDAIKESISHDGDMLRKDVSSCEISDDEPLASIVKRTKQIQDTLKKDNGNVLMDMEEVIPANIISGLPQTLSFVSDPQKENTQAVKDTEDKESNFDDIKHKQDGQYIQDVESGKDITDIEMRQEEQDVENRQDTQDLQDANDGQDMEDGRNVDDGHDVYDEQDMEDGQDVDNEDDQDNFILGF